MKARLSVLYFLQFAVWGCYLSCFGQLLGAGGLGQSIQWFYAAVGLVSLFTPALFGHFADRFAPSRSLLGGCHLIASVVMFGAWTYASSHPQLDFTAFFLLYLGFLAFYMPTMALANTTTFAIIRSRGGLPMEQFPKLRIWGTIGFIAAMWFVNSAYIHDGMFGFTLSDTNPAAHFRFQYTPMQLLVSSIIGLVTGLYALTLPVVKAPLKSAPSSFADIFGLRAFKLFKIPSVRTFLIFAVLTGVCLQISNGFAIPFINHFMGDPDYAGSLAAGNATLLFSLSQISEAFCILLVGVAMKRIGFRWVITIALLAWCIRFLCLGLGNPGDGLILLVISMLVYGVAFNFFNIAGHIYMEQSSDSSNKGFGQGLLMLMSNGIGATGGMIIAGSVVNSYCHWEMVKTGGAMPMRLFMGDWTTPWLIFAGYALTVAVLFAVCFRAMKSTATSVEGDADKGEDAE